MKNNTHVSTLFLLASLSLNLILPQLAKAEGQCQALFTQHPASVNILADPIRQLIMWEQTSNQDRWAKPTAPIRLDYIKIVKSDLVVRTETFTPDSIKSYFSSDSTVKWVRHPLNTSNTVPYRDSSGDGIKSGYFSASRSMFTTVGGGLFTFKLPTNRPHPEAALQPGKADLNNDSIISMRRSKHIRTYDSKHELSDSLYVLTEVISVASKKGNAFSVRDLRPLQDGNYYLPAFSIPYAGREIAAVNHEDFDQFWNKNYGALLGKAKAQLLLRYGLQMKTPNAQNWLVQLDKNLKPTGRMYMRDVADSNYVEFIAEYNGSKRQIEADRKSEFTIMTDLQPYWENSAWQMDEGGVTHKTLAEWGISHDRAYVQTIENALGISNGFSSISELQDYLKSDIGVAALKRYSRKLSQQSNANRTTEKAS